MLRWHEYSRDPNAREVIERRGEALREARSGKLVLIALVICASWWRENRSWMSGLWSTRERPVRVPIGCIGICVVQPGAVLWWTYLRHRLTTFGPKALMWFCADITAKPLPEKFDVIIAGEVLEHIEVPGHFMNHCSQMRKPGGRLVVTVPNPWYANRLWKNAWSRFHSGGLSPGCISAAIPPSVVTK
jgi:hypothetical protein